MTERRDSDRADVTAAGRLAAAHAEAVLARLEAARADLAATVEAHPLRVGVYEAIIEHVMPSIAERLLGLSIAVCQSIDDSELLDRLKAGTVDLAFAALPLPRGPFECTELLEEPYMLVAPTSWASGKRLDRLGIIELASTRLVGLRHSRTLSRLEAALEAEGHCLRIVRRAGSDAEVRKLVGAGAGAAILPRLSVDLSDPKTTAIELRGFPPRTLALVWHRYRHLPSAVESFRAAATAVGDRLTSQMVGEGRPDGLRRR